MARVSWVGSIIAGKLKALGYIEGDNCNCSKMIRKINRWTIEQCQERSEEIVEHLRKAAMSAGWIEKIAVSLPVVQHYATEIIRTLVHQAIDEAEALKR